MNQKIATWVGTTVLLIVAITACVFVWVYEKNQPAIEQPNIQVVKPKKTESVACTMEAKLCADGSYVSRTGPNCEFAACPEVTNDATADLRVYRNEKLGFELSIPNTVGVDVGTEKERTGDVNVMENGNIVFISVNSGDSLVKEEIEKINSSKSEYEKVQGVSWAILVKEINGDAGLLDFIQRRYGKTCKLGEKNPDFQDGVFDVKIVSSLPEGGCFLNYGLVVKYYPAKNLVAAWDLGQAPVFFKKIVDENNPIFDTEMKDSFKFIK